MTVDFTNGVIDRAYFKGARGVLFNNAVLSSSSFDEADLTDADFTEAYLGQFDQKRLCKNPKLTGENLSPVRRRARADALIVPAVSLQLRGRALDGDAQHGTVAHIVARRSLRARERSSPA